MFSDVTLSDSNISSFLIETVHCEFMYISNLLKIITNDELC